MGNSNVFHYGSYTLLAYVIPYTLFQINPIQRPYIIQPSTLLSHVANSQPHFQASSHHISVQHVESNFIKNRCVQTQ